jgi:DNA-binding transcriptional LysR family regulator
VVELCFCAPQGVVVRAGHPVLGAPTLAGNAAQEWTLASNLPEGRGALIRQLFDDPSAAPSDRVLLYESHSTAVALVRNRDVQSLVSEPLLALPECQDIAIVPIDRPPLETGFNLVRQGDMLLTHAAAWLARSWCKPDPSGSRWAI